MTMRPLRPRLSGSLSKPIRIDPLPRRDFSSCASISSSPAELLLRELFLGPAIYPVIYCFVPEFGVLRLQHPMAFIGEVEHLGGHALHLQRGKKLQAFAYIQAIIFLSMNDEGRSLEIFRILVLRKILIQPAVVVGSSFERLVLEPQFFGGPPGGLCVEHAVVPHQALEAVGVAEDPVDGVPAI